MKKIIFSLIIILLFGGCYNYKELNDYAIATGMSIDYKNDKYKVSFLIANSPKESSESNKQFQTIVYSGKGKTIYEAVKNIGLISPKQLYIGHLSVVVISEEVAKKGLYDSLNFLLIEPQSKKDFNVVLAKDTDADNILKITTPLVDFPSQAIDDNIKSTDYLQGSVTATDFNSLVKKLINQNIDPVMNGFVIVGDEKKGQTEKNLQSTSLKSYIKIDNLGIFKDDKFIAWATKDESRGINIINNNVREMYLNLPCEDGYIVVNTEQFKSSMSVDKSGMVTINVKSQAIINEISCNIDIKDHNVIKNIEKRANKKMKGWITKGINLSKKYNTDLFGIGDKYYQNYPNEYNKINDWEKYFNNLDFKLNVDINIKNNGSSQQSIERISNEKNN